MQCSDALCVYEETESLKSTFVQIHDGGRHRNWAYFNRNNSAAACSTAPKFGTWMVRGEGVAELLNV